ncbi:MAG: hypothetical protein GY838_16790 [bacterium]|nr:hypothetical protein [bacterium]
MRPFLICALALLASGAAAHESHGTFQMRGAVIVTFEDHDGGAAEGWAFTVLDPEGATWSRGFCDARGQTVFAPDRTGDWKVRVFAPDGHGGEVMVPVDEDLAAGPPAPAPGRSPWIRWIVIAAVVLAVIRFAGRMRR